MTSGSHLDFYPVLSAYETDPEPRTLGGWEGKVWIAEGFDEPREQAGYPPQPGEPARGWNNR